MGYVVVKLGGKPGGIGMMAGLESCSAGSAQREKGIEGAVSAWAILGVFHHHVSSSLVPAGEIREECIIGEALVGLVSELWRLT